MLIKHRTKNSAAFWPNLDALYKARLNSFLELAGHHIYNRDHAIDVVHNAFAKSVSYFNKNPNKKVSEFIVRNLILRACKKENRFSREKPAGLMNEPYQDVNGE